MRGEWGVKNRSAWRFLECEKYMVTVRVKGGTPRQEGTLCQTCRNAHIIKGFSESEEKVFCRMFYIKREIPFSVFQCSMYDDKRLASRVEMEEIAWFLTTRKSGRSVGFVSAARFRQLELEDAKVVAIDQIKAESTE